MNQMTDEEKLFQFHFKYIENEKKSECRHCNRKYEGKNASNLKRHLNQFHKNYASDTNMIYTKRKRIGHENDEQEVPTKKFKKLTNQELAQICVEFTTVNLLPYNFFSSSSLKKLILGTGCSLTINPQNVKNLVDFSAQKIRESIATEIKDKMISLKVDMASRLGRSILGINIQFFSLIEKRIVIRTIGMIEMKRKHTSENIHSMISKVLQDFEIDKRQISSFTCDNGANIIASAKKFQDYQNSLLLQEEMNMLNDIVAEECDNDDDDEDEECFNENGPTDIPTIVKDAMEDITSIAVLVRCSVHTLQLAVHDALKEIKKNNNTNLEIVRNVVKNLKSSTYSEPMHRLKIKSPSVDVCTRWNSSFVMVHKLLSIKNDIQRLYEYVEDGDLDGITLTENDWEFISMFHEAFLPCYQLTLKLQDSNISMGNRLNRIII